ncbi:hypothetical protein D770_11560 [Flammeovirgaceae bacterium 311]|nr:hypothetical protein D770_11560 [Flammeovirgaceae bacterium 311]
MFIGHFAVGFGAKKAQPAISLGTYFLAAQWLDLLWPTLLLLELEQVVINPGITVVNPLEFTHYPISHSLLMVLVWSGLFALGYWLLKKNRAGAMVLGLCVLSHWVLDLIMHRPDLPLYPGDSPLLGLGLWNSLPGTILVEGLVFAAGLALYLRATTAVNKKGIYGLWSLVVFLVVIQTGNLFGPPPPDVAGIAWAGHLQWLFVLWGYWVDKNRMPATEGLATNRKVLVKGV